MRNRSYLLVFAAVLVAAGGIAMDRSVTASAAQSAPPVATRIVAPEPATGQPLDAGYMVPGVLDDRSWKPEYDRMPAASPATDDRPLREPVRRSPVVTASVQDDPPQAAPADAQPAPIAPQAADSDTEAASTPSA